MEAHLAHNSQTEAAGHPSLPPVEFPVVGLPEHPSVSDDALRSHVDALIAQWEMLPSAGKDTSLPQRLKDLGTRLKLRLQTCRRLVPTGSKQLTPALEFLESTRLMESVLLTARDATKTLLRVPHIRIASATSDIPRVVGLAEGYLSVVRGIWSADSLSAYVSRAQTHDPLLLREIGSLPLALKLAQLEFLLDRADEAFAAGALPPIEQSPFSAPLHSLRRLNQAEWNDILEPLIAFDAILRADPAGVYGAMDEETRGSYRNRVAELACHADDNEVATAQAALALARAADLAGDADPRRHQRQRHIGCYLFAEGRPELDRKIGFHAPPAERLRFWVLGHNEDVYILGIFLLAVLLIFVLIVPLVPHHTIWPIVGALLLALLPASQTAVDLVNSAVSALMKTDALPKLDLEDGIPAGLSTVVVVPTLLLSEMQVRELFDELEARYLANQDAHLHFALVTDLPDSVGKPTNEDRDPLVLQAIAQVDTLNAKYAHEDGGKFLLLHRHRVFNARQGVWMGWERKRGKLLDLNKLMLGDYDSFPVKAGPVDLLRRVKYVITLDSDTQLPRGTAGRMIGTLAHPLNQGIIDPRRRVVTHGYGILQPRVGVSVASASRSRLAAIYSGETGFDIYTRAVSDVYQDLFGEGIFTGKGIYEVAIFHQVLDHRFPRNALLSHDLIEGAYVRAGLVTDVEVIDDYPSRYAAHAKRKHRWVRGDWQIVQWLFGRVPDESGRMVANPISTISRWKILDNLRRSLVEPVTFLLLVLGWFVLPGGPRYWTLAVLLLLLLPSAVQFALGLVRAALKPSAAVAHEALSTLGASLGFVLINLVFLPHQMLLSVDAIARSALRVLVSGRNLLEWETAAQAEQGNRRSSLDLYLQFSPLLAVLLGAGLYLTHRHAPLALLAPTGPILLLWIIAPLLVLWLDSSPRAQKGPLSSADTAFLRRHALLIWRFFAEFGNEDNHWLIPDNVEEAGVHQVRKLSPTNLGMLFNARQAAVEFGFLTLPEFARATLGTLDTYERLDKVRGHIFNWYDIASLQAVPPFTVSAVDSGNLAASLYTLHTGALDLLNRGLRFDPYVSDDDWTPAEAAARQNAQTRFLHDYTPWRLPEFAVLDQTETPMPVLAQAPEYVRTLRGRITDPSLSAKLGFAEQNLAQLRVDLATVAERAFHFADLMEFGFLFNKSRQLLSIGYDAPSNEVHSACYDLLSSESRIASFLAVAKGDIPQQAWFRLDRTHVLVRGRAALVSWTGTMFEYMMPSLWMETFPNTLLSRSLDAAVRIQRDHPRTLKRGDLPWGISEAGFAVTDAQGRYGYQAWGIPALALKYGAEDGPVISPYSTFLALPLLRDDALANLRRMEKLGWVGEYGFYEAADYTEGESKLVRSWMAHHQGMSLLSLLNLLHGNIVQRWFHANPRVRAAELLLHEKPVSKQSLHSLTERAASASAKPEPA